MYPPPQFPSDPDPVWQPGARSGRAAGPHRLHRAAAEHGSGRLPAAGRHLPAAARAEAGGRAAVGGLGGGGRGGQGVNEGRRDAGEGGGGREEGMGLGGWGFAGGVGLGWSGCGRSTHLTTHFPHIHPIHTHLCLTRNIFLLLFNTHTSAPAPSSLHLPPHCAGLC